MDVSVMVDVVIVNEDVRLLLWRTLSSMSLSWRTPAPKLAPSSQTLPSSQRDVNVRDRVLQLMKNRCTAIAVVMVEGHRVCGRQRRRCR